MTIALLNNFEVETTRTRKKRATTEYLKRSGIRNRDSRIQVQLWKMEAAVAQDITGWRKVVCGLCSTGSDKA